MGGQGLDGGDKVVMGGSPVPLTRENPVVAKIKLLEPPGLVIA